MSNGKTVRCDFQNEYNFAPNKVLLMSLSAIYSTVPWKIMWPKLIYLPILNLQRLHRWSLEKDK